MDEPNHWFVLAIVLIGGLLPFCVMQNLPTESEFSMGGGRSYSRQNYGFPFVAISVRKTEFLFVARTPELDNPDWHFAGLLLNLLLALVFFVGLFSTTRRLLKIRSTRFYLSHILQLTFAISICLVVYTNELMLYGWMTSMFNLEFDVNVIFPRPLWQTATVYCNLLALSLAVVAWFASVCSTNRPSVAKNVG